MYLKTTIIAVLVMLAGATAAHAYTAEIPAWAEEGASKAASEGVARKQEEESRAKAAQEAQARETQAQEVQAQAAQEHRVQEEQKQREERERQEASEREAESREASKVAVCVVPSLRGDSLHEARKALGSAHCRLGSVSNPRQARRDALVVIRQDRRVGEHLSVEARVAVTMGFAARKRH